MGVVGEGLAPFCGDDRSIATEWSVIVSRQQ